MKSAFQIIFLLCFSLITGLYIRHSSINNMNQAYNEGCNSAALKLERMENNSFLFDFCIIRAVLNDKYGLK